MNRGTDLEANYEAQLDSIIEALGPVHVSVETVGQLVAPVDGIGSTLYLPNLDDFAKIIDGIRPSLKAMVDVGQQIAGSGLKTLGKRLAQWRKRVNALASKSVKRSYLSLFEKFLLRSAMKVITQLLRVVSIPSSIGTFVQQVFESSSLMLTGPPSHSTGLPIKNPVTTWGRMT